MYYVLAYLCKQKEILSYVKIYMNFEDITLSEISQSQKHITWFHLYKVSTLVKLLKAGSKIVISRSWGKGKMGSYSSMDRKFQLQKM